MQSSEILATVLSSIEQGVVVLDPELRLVAWSRRYEEVMDVDSEMLYAGRPSEEIVRFLVQRGDVMSDHNDVEIAVRDHMTRLRADLNSNKTRSFVRRNNRGEYLEVIRRPLPDGGLVFTIADVTEREVTQREIEAAAD